MILEWESFSKLGADTTIFLRAIIIPFSLWQITSKTRLGHFGRLWATKRMVKFGSFTDVWFGLGLPVCWPGQREAIEFHHEWERQKIINGSAILAPWGDSGIKTSGIEALYFLYYLLQVCQACVHFVSVSAFIQLTWGTEQERVGEGMAVSLLLPVSQPAVTGTVFFQSGDEAQHPYFFSLQYVPRLLFLSPQVSEHHQPSRTKPWKLQ